MFDSMSSGVTVCDAVDDGEDFVILNMNTANRKIEALEGKDIIGRKISLLFPEFREAGLLDIYRRVWKSGRPEHTGVCLHRDHRHRQSFRKFL